MMRLTYWCMKRDSSSRGDEIENRDWDAWGFQTCNIAFLPCSFYFLSHALVVCGGVTGVECWGSRLISGLGIGKLWGELTSTDTDQIRWLPPQASIWVHTHTSVQQHKFHYSSHIPLTMAWYRRIKSEEVWRRAIRLSKCLTWNAMPCSETESVPLAISNPYLLFSSLGPSGPRLPSRYDAASDASNARYRLPPPLSRVLDTNTPLPQKKLPMNKSSLASVAFGKYDSNPAVPNNSKAARFIVYPGPPAGNPHILRSLL